MAGLFLFAVGIVLILDSKLGLSPWDVLNQGISRHTPLSFGLANVVVAVVVLLVAWSLGGRPGVGTVANAVLIGSIIQGLTSIHALSALAHDGLSVRIPLLVVGIWLIGPATAFYIGADLGAGPRDTLMLVGARRTRFRVGVVRATIELGCRGGDRARRHVRRRHRRVRAPRWTGRSSRPSSCSPARRSRSRRRLPSRSWWTSERAACAAGELPGLRGPRGPGRDASVELGGGAARGSAQLLDRDVLARPARTRHRSGHSGAAALRIQHRRRVAQGARSRPDPRVVVHLESGDDVVVVEGSGETFEPTQ